MDISSTRLFDDIYRASVLSQALGKAQVCREPALPRGMGRGRRGSGTSDLTALMQSDPPWDHKMHWINSHRLHCFLLPRVEGKGREEEEIKILFFKSLIHDKTCTCITSFNPHVSLKYR